MGFESGKSIIMISSDMPELISMSDRIGVMRNGRMTHILPAEDLDEESLIRHFVGADDFLHAIGRRAHRWACFIPTAKYNQFMTAAEAQSHRPRRWLSLTARVLRLLWRQGQTTGELVQSSYDQIAGGYDEVWTHHMRDLTDALLARLLVRPGESAVDLTCGTGYLTGKLLRRKVEEVTGVDASAGMVQTARANYPDARFVHADALDYLRSRRPESADVITSGWGLGYCSPPAVLGEIRRVLRPGGRVAIIDNSLFSLAGVLWASLRAFAEHPGALQHVMKVKFLPHSLALISLMRLAGLGVSAHGDGNRSYSAPDGHAALDRLRATGAAAGFEFAAGAEHTQAVFDRFAEIIQADCAPGAVRIVHRYLWALGVRS